MFILSTDNLFLSRTLKTLTILMQSAARMADKAKQVLPKKLKKIMQKLEKA